jgi:hypothetical protein
MEQYLGVLPAAAISNCLQRSFLYIKCTAIYCGDAADAAAAALAAS